MHQVKRDADSTQHRYGSPGWRRAEARKIERNDATHKGWRYRLREVRFHRWFRAQWEAGVPLSKIIQKLNLCSHQTTSENSNAATA
jgi:hypothetical protein